MSLSPHTIAWLIAAALSALALSKLMRRRQAELVVVLRDYVDRQLEWSRKKAKAAQLARRAARHKAEQEAEDSRVAASHDQDHYSKYDQPESQAPTPEAPTRDPAREVATR